MSVGNLSERVCVTCICEKFTCACMRVVNRWGILSERVRESVGDLSEHVRVMYRIMYLCCA